MRFVKETFPKKKKRLLLVLRINLVALVCFTNLAFFLPLSRSEKWVLIPIMAFLAGVNWALLTHGKKR